MIKFMLAEESAEHTKKKADIGCVSQCVCVFVRVRERECVCV